MVPIMSVCVLYQIKSKFPTTFQKFPDTIRPCCNTYISPLFKSGVCPCPDKIPVIPSYLINVALPYIFKISSSLKGHK